MRNVPFTMRLRLAVALVGIGAALLLAYAAAPANALSGWQHDSAVGCGSCHSYPAPDNSKCSFCHTGYTAAPGATCWECHKPGASTAALRSSAACSATCHLYSSLFKNYVIPYSHGATPHVGADAGACLDCHSLTVSVFDPGTSEHHAGVAVSPPTCEQCHNGTLASAKQSHDASQCTDCHSGMNIPAVPAACNRCHAATKFGTGDCTNASCHGTSIVHTASPAVPACATCHVGYKKHAGTVACIKCHTNPAKFHHGTAAMVAKKCASCHSVKHANRTVSVAKCLACHKGNAPVGKARVQHSATITKLKRCSACHAQKVHAKSYKPSMTCQSCHKGPFHAWQKLPNRTLCLSCHSSAARHSVGLSCLLCHRSQIHNPTPRPR
jgi:hypothetical protein